MSSQRTFSIIKPDAIRKGYAAAILAEIDKAGFKHRRHQEAVPLQVAGRGLLLRPRAAALLRLAHDLHVLGHHHRARA